ncbi:hypothetical protein [Nonomuraea guangzhouensis]|uniref:Uncharacterized protein n=1 Tax=Nonomuraea guangzhouensis TaxID=1291555 RepID=A0ABW4GCY9_9ACTN|nr:hypothetical protein [Nonomuraea guangzhouensis]
MATVEETLADVERPAARDDIDEQMAEASLQAAYPAWTIWCLHGIWYATGPCHLIACGCRRTLHAPRGEGLRDLLAAQRSGGEETT